VSLLPVATAARVTHYGGEGAKVPSIK